MKKQPNETREQVLQRRLDLVANGFIIATMTAGALFAITRWQKSDVKRLEQQLETMRHLAYTSSHTAEMILTRFGDVVDLEALKVMEAAEFLGGS